MHKSDFTSGFSTLLGLLILSGGLLLLDNSRLLVGPRSFLMKLILPFQGVVYGVGREASNTMSFFIFWKNGMMKINNLEERVRELTVQSERVKVLEDENQSLREQLGVPFSKNRKMLMADVVGFSQNLSINKGTNDGLKEGMTVIYKDIYLGKVVNVGSNSSQVRISTDPASKITAVTSKTRAKGIAAGRFGSAVYMEKVVQEESLSKSDIVLTSGEDGTQNGLVVGKIAEVKKEDTGVFQTAKLDLLVDFPKLISVFVLLE